MTTRTSPDMRVGVHGNAVHEPRVSGTKFDFGFSLVVGNWESVGPSGSGANNIWTALDVVPNDVSWIAISLLMAAWGDGNTAISNVLYGRAFGSSAGGDLLGYVSSVITPAPTQHRVMQHSQIMMPVKDRKFEAKLQSNGVTYDGAEAYITGYGWNRPVHL